MRISSPHHSKNTSPLKDIKWCERRFFLNSPLALQTEIHSLSAPAAPGPKIIQKKNNKKKQTLVKRTLGQYSIIDQTNRNINTVESGWFLFVVWQSLRYIVPLRKRVVWNWIMNIVQQCQNFRIPLCFKMGVHVF